MALPKIALLIESSRGYGRSILRGIAAYGRSHGLFSIYRQDQGLGESVPMWLQSWQGDGVIARIETKGLADLLLERGLPTVDLRCRYSFPSIPTVETNELSVAQLACDHLLKCGVTRFAFCGFEGVDYSQTREAFALEYLAQRGHTAIVYNSQSVNTTDTVGIESEGLIHDQELGEWLQALPKPIGLLACNDIRAAQVLNVCREIEIKVPDEVAVLGVDDDRLICELTTPPLSSVELDAFRIGYIAAERLLQLIRGTSAIEPRTLIRAKGVVRRQSTELFQIDDPDVALALKYIHQHACEGISLDDVAAATHLSRSTLVRRFAKYAGTTVKSEITRIRVNRIKQLLVDTEYSLTKIADLAGFATVEYMSTMFKEHTGETPAQYRKLYQYSRTSSD